MGYSKEYVVVLSEIIFYHLLFIQFIPSPSAANLLIAILPADTHICVYVYAYIHIYIYDIYNLYIYTYIYNMYAYTHIYIHIAKCRCHEGFA